MLLRFSGSSDDTFNWEDDHGKGGEVDGYEKPCWLRVQAPDGTGLMVFGHYAPKGCPDGTWIIGVTLLAEDADLPDWPTRYATAVNGYSPELLIQAPNGTTVTTLEAAS